MWILLSVWFKIYHLTFLYIFTCHESFEEFSAVKCFSFPSKVITCSNLLSLKWCHWKEIIRNNINKERSFNLNTLLFFHSIHLQLWSLLHLIYAILWEKAKKTFECQTRSSQQPIFQWAFILYYRIFFFVFDNQNRCFTAFRLQFFSNSSVYTLYL